jgi:hypothetical protein
MKLGVKKVGQLWKTGNLELGLISECDVYSNERTHSQTNTGGKLDLDEKLCEFQKLNVINMRVQTKWSRVSIVRKDERTSTLKEEGNSA